MDELLARARDGDAEARNALVEHFTPDVLAFLERESGAKLRRAFSTRDLCQEVFLQVLGSLDSLPDDADLGTFRGRLIQNAGWILARHGRKAQGFHGASAAGLPASPPPTVEETAPRTGVVTRGDDLRQLHDLLDRLGPLYGDVVRLRMEGLDFAEIAARLDRTDAAVRKQYARAVDALRKVVGAPGPLGPLGS